MLYAAPGFATAFIETVVRDRFVRRPERNVAWREITERAWARITARPGTVLTLLDLRGAGCARVGAPTDAVHARNHAAGRAFAKAVHAEHADIEGLLYDSRWGEACLCAADWAIKVLLRSVYRGAPPAAAHRSGGYLASLMRVAEYVSGRSVSSVTVRPMSARNAKSMACARRSALRHRRTLEHRLAAVERHHARTEGLLEGLRDTMTARKGEDPAQKEST